MKYDNKLIEDAVLALLAAHSFNNGQAWKGFDFEIMTDCMSRVTSITQ
jgi:hypothetical protein